MITRLRLENFKNFRDATLPLGPLTVLVGTNASGKSNLRDAFRFLHGISRGYTLAEIIGEKYGPGGDLQWEGIRGGTREIAYFGEQRFGLEVDLLIEAFANAPSFGEIPPPQNYSYEVEVEIPWNYRSPRVIRESLHQGRSVIYDTHPCDDPPHQEGSPYLFARLPSDRSHPILRFLDNQPILSQSKVYRDFQNDPKLSSVERAMQLASSDCMRSLGSMRFLDLSPQAMKKPSLPGQIVLGDRGENLSSVLQAICEDKTSKEAVTEWINELTPLDVTDFEFVADPTGKVLVTLVESNGQKTSAHSASDGTLRFLAMIAAILGPDAAKFYFFEELDTGIHPTRLHLLLQLIEQQANRGKVQVVATTHSPQLLAMLSESAREHASLIYRPDDDAAARIRPINTIPDIHRVLENQNLSRLLESGWLEDAMAFSEEEEAEA